MFDRTRAQLKGALKKISGRSYEQRIAREQEFFNDCTNVHELPQIFHYWSNKYLLPKHKPFGINDPEHFFFVYSERICRKNAGQHTRIVSIGSGNCDMEALLAQRLVESGCIDFTLECVDINQKMLDRGRDHAQKANVEKHLVFQRGDFNAWEPKDDYDVIIANQALHHVLELEHLFKTIKRHLRKGGVFLTSDMIGRNGHLRWPEARAALAPFWEEMPEKYRYNQLLRRHEQEFIDHDCSVESFEGIRAQDILPLLVKNFEFELFIPFANIIMVFIDRPFGHNFNAEADWDRDFIDRVHARDEAGILSGELKPTQMLAVLRNESVDTSLVDPRLTPEFCIRPPGS